MINNHVDLSTRRKKGFCEENTQRVCPRSNYQCDIFIVKNNFKKGISLIII